MSDQINTGQSAPTLPVDDSPASRQRTQNSRSPLHIVGGFLRSVRNIILNTLFFTVLILILIGAVNSCQNIQVPPDSALLIQPQGVLVESVSQPLGVQQLIAQDQRATEIPLHDVLDAIRIAQSDDLIKMIVLDLDQLSYASPAQAARIGTALNRFKGDGKKIIAVGDYYAQHQYHIASYADAVYMHPQGQVVLQGYGGNSFYLKELLEKLSVSVHVFRAGEFKQATEPFTRNEMSPEARLASEALYQDLWQQTVLNVATNRQLEPHAVQAYADRLPQFVGATQGDFARAALENHLIDELLTSDQARVRIGDEVGYDTVNGDINGISMAAYLAARSDERPSSNDGSAQIAILTLQGPIVVDGPDATSASANAIIPLIQQARFDDRVKAVVLRVDSPGGSQFASEVIRQELELLQLSGKPVVASFASAAASGGYWVAATADAIVSESATITGSIGIFSFITTYEESLKRIGVHSDGVGTSAQTLSMDLFSGISADAANMIQARVDHGYDQFLNLVSRGRDLPLDDVRDIAEGRIWSGAAAQEIGLVDDIGGLSLALDRAAKLADLESFTSRRLAHPMDARSQIIRELLGVQSLTELPAYLQRGMFANIAQQLHQFNMIDDPFNVYALCSVCLK